MSCWKNSEQKFFWQFFYKIAKGEKNLVFNESVNSTKKNYPNSPLKLPPPPPYINGIKYYLFLLNVVQYFSFDDNFNQKISYFHPLEISSLQDQKREHVSPSCRHSGPKAFDTKDTTDECTQKGAHIKDLCDAIYHTFSPTLYGTRSIKYVTYTHAYVSKHSHSAMKKQRWKKSSHKRE